MQLFWDSFLASRLRTRSRFPRVGREGGDACPLTEHSQGAPLTNHATPGGVLSTEIQSRDHFINSSAPWGGCPKKYWVGKAKEWQSNEPLHPFLCRSPTERDRGSSERHQAPPPAPFPHPTAMAGGDWQKEEGQSFPQEPQTSQVNDKCSSSTASCEEEEGNPSQEFSSTENEKLPQF